MCVQMQKSFMLSPDVDTWTLRGCYGLLLVYEVALCHVTWNVAGKA